MNWILSIFLFFLASCSQNNGSYKIGVDPSWYPFNFGDRESSVNTFSSELLQEIGKIKKIEFSILKMNWDNLQDGLQKNKYSGILTSVQPFVFYEKQFDFSTPFLMTGPVLVVPINSKVTSLEMLKGKEIAILAGSSDAPLLEKTPGILLRYYKSIPQALTDLTHGYIEGVVIPVLTAESYMQDLYQGKVKIATAPLNSEGLRLVTLHDQNSELQDLFNSALAELKQNGTYLKLLQKWNLDGTQAIK